MNDELLEKLQGLLSEVSGKDASGLLADTDLVEGLGIDSLTGLRYLAVIEKTYGVRFPDQELSGIRTLGQVCAYVKNENKGGEG